ncbi:MAG: hypothetical protein ACK5KQ_03970 [Anaerorhabdus sp.]
MLFKLLKHEFKNNYKLYFLLNFCVLFFSFTASNFKPNNTLINLFMFMIYLASMIALFFFVVYSVVTSFKNSMFGKRGYLTLTMPVSTSTIILSKYLMCIFWILISVLSVIFSFFAFSNLFPNDLLSYVFSLDDIWAIILNLFISVILSALSFVSVVFLCVTISQTSVFKKYRNLIAFILFVVISFALSYINAGITDKIFYETLYSTTVYTSVNTLLTYMNLYSFISTGIVAIVFFVFVKYLIDNKIELE